MSAALTVVTPCLNYLLIYVARMGTDGAALANNVEAALYCAMLLTYLIVKERGLGKAGRHTWHGWCAALPEAALAFHPDEASASPSRAALGLQQASQPPIAMQTWLLPRAQAQLERACVALAAKPDQPM